MTERQTEPRSERQATARRGRILWEPPLARRRASNLERFLGHLERTVGRRFADYDGLHRWSVEEMGAFWKAVLEFSGVIHSGSREEALADRRLPGARWFPGVELNFAENLLREDGARAALVFEAEDEELRRVVTFGELRRQVARARAGLIRLGVRAGDRVAAFTPNVPEAVTGFLASASLGAVWSSCSPDFGVQGVVDRLGQIGPKVLFAASSSRYAGKAHDLEDRLRAIVERLPSVEATIVYPGSGAGAGAAGRARAPAALRGRVSFDDFLGGREEGGEPPLVFKRLPFAHPLAILYTSGTTGKPKCIVHGAGGTLLKHLEEHQLQVDLKPEDVFFYFTTTGWMMWNWLVSGLATGATVVLYDGSPLHPDPGRLFRLAARNAISVFGTSPRYLSAVARSGLVPRAGHSLAALRTVLSTGAPLHAEQFEWVYRNIKEDVQLASISGGTDLIGCFVLSSPFHAVRAGEISCRALGMAVESAGEDGRALSGETGELVCSAPFPSLPLGFWDDPDGSRYRAAYFERFPGKWHHGDFIRFEDDGASVIFGRSDATLNPGGVRIGTAEIYRAVETVPEVEEALAVSRRAADGDVEVVLFVVLAPGVELDDSLRAAISRTIRERISPRHVPAAIHAIPEVPRTISGKTVEIAVAQILRGEEVTNREALLNPQALDAFRRFAPPP